jgi:sugar phosphate isomerase/epimerase
MNSLRQGLFSVSYAGLWGQQRLPIEGVIEKAAKLGFEGILLMGKQPHLSPLEMVGADIARLRAVLDGCGIKAIGVAAYNDFCMPAPIEVPVDEFQLAYIEACCRVSAALGGSLVRIFTGYDHDLSGHSTTSARWRKLVDMLRCCGDRAARHGVQVAVQNHHDLAVDSSLLDLLLTEIDHPNVLAGYDAWSPFLRGEDLHAGARLLAARTVLTIAANYRRFPRYQYEPDLVNYRRLQPDLVKACFMSRGELDYRPFFRGLMEGGYDGWVVYETCSPLIEGASEAVLDGACKDFLAYMHTQEDIRCWRET